VKKKRYIKVVKSTRENNIQNQKSRKTDQEQVHL